MNRINLPPFTQRPSDSWRKCSPPLAVLILSIAASTGMLPAQSISVSNGSFESPTPPQGFPVTVQVDSWQKTLQPAWFNPADFQGVTWDQLSGAFPNTPQGQPDHIDNVDGDQAAYLFTLSEVGFTQELTETYQAGMSYDLTVGILGGGGIVDGDSFLIGLYYLDAGNPVTIASTQITYSLASFPTVTHLNDYSISLSDVQVTDAWEGEQIGIELRSLVGTGSGYWDLDNVRLTAVPEPSTLGLLAVGLGGGFLLARRNRSSRGGSSPDGK